MKFRLAELMVVVSVLSFGCVALTQADPLFETLFYSFTAALVLVSVLMVVGRTLEKRAFWIGFGITLVSYLVFANGEDANGIAPRHQGPEITTQLLRLSFNWIHAGEYELEDVPKGNGGMFSVEDKLQEVDVSSATEPAQHTPVPFSSSLSLVINGGQQLVADGRSISFMRIGHGLWGLTLGWIAGHFTAAVYRQSHRTEV